MCVPGDKSISHRVLILGSMARGTTFAKGVPDGQDVAATVACLQALGVKCQRVADAVSVEGLGRKPYRKPDRPLDCGGSATTMRLLLGAVTGRGAETVFTGNASLSQRPMDRVIEPLSRMGAVFGATEGKFAPVTVRPAATPNAIDYLLSVPSSQVKTALILAGLNVPRGRTVIRGALGSRDHAERLVPQMGGTLVVTPESIMVERCDLQAVAFSVPGDPSAAAFFATGAALLDSSRIELRGVSTNPTRTGFFEALSWMGGDVSIVDDRDSAREPRGTITVRHAPLRGIEIHKEAIPFLVDEVPLLMLLASVAEGETVIHGISELRLKETDRINCTVEGLTRMGAAMAVDGDSVRIQGGTRLKGAVLDPWGDHRMSMMFTLAGLAASGDTTVLGIECESKSFPGFYASLERLLK